MAKQSLFMRSFKTVSSEIFVRTYFLRIFVNICELVHCFTNFKSSLIKTVVVLIFLCFGVKFLCCLSLMYVFIFLVQFG